MKFNYKNREKLNEQYIHDSCFKGYQYDYDTRKINLSCIDRFHDRKIELIFYNVIFSELQSCDFWIPGLNSIYDIWYEDESVQMKQLINNIDSKESNRLTEGIEYIQVKMQITSGDTFFIICEEIEWKEEIDN